MSFIEDLIERSVAAAASDPGWLGSTEQLDFLTKSLPDLGVEDATVAWAPTGRASNWERITRTIEIERVTSGAIPATDEEIAIHTARSVLHECLHARYSTPSSFDQRVLMIDPRLQRTARVIFNVPEDARVARVATSDEPELAGVIAGHLNAAVDQIDQFSGTSGSGSAPTDQRNQLVFAVLAYILAPDRKVVLNPEVAAELDKLRPIIDDARQGARTEVMVGVASDLVNRIMRFPPPTVAAR